MSKDGILGSFDLLGADDERELPPAKDIIHTRQTVRGLANRLEDERLSYADRQTVAEAIERFLQYVAEVTTARVEYVPVEHDPSTDELADTLHTLADGVTEDYLNRDCTTDVLEQVRNETARIHAVLDDAEPFPYAFKENQVEVDYQKQLMSHGERTDLGDDVPADEREETYAGPYARYQIERHADNPGDPLWLGTGTRNGKDAPVDKEALFRHTSIFGPTGYGKSTLLANSFLQVIRAGHGACFIDPKGDDSLKLMERIPDDRLDDVIWIEPGSSREYVSGFNFINLGLDPDADQYDTALTNLVDDLAVMVGADEWPRMKRVARNLVRAMNMYNRSHPDTPDLNLIDLYYILASEASRHEFAARAAAAGLDFVHEYTEMIAEMDDSDLEPLLGRFQPLVEDPLARRMIGFREADLNIPKAVENDKIIIVRMSDESDRLKADLGMAIVRRLWATIRTRSEQREHARDPYYLFVDEFDDIAKRDGSITTMLSESRSYRLALFFCCQYPDQLPDPITEAMFVNSDTQIAFNPGSPKQARKIAPQLGLDAETLLAEVKYHIWTQITLDESLEQSQAFRVYTHPPYPPLRTREDAETHVLESLKRHGRERKTAADRKQELLFNEGHGQLETGYGIEIERAEEPEVEQMYKDDLRRAVEADDRGADPDAAVDDPTGPDQGDSDADGSDDVDQLLEDELDTILEAIFAARLRAGQAPGQSVPLAAVEREAEYRLGETGYLSEFANLIERLPSDLVGTARHDGTMHVGLTDTGRARAVAQDTGSGSSAGGAAHRYVLAKAYATFTRLGYLVTLPEQSTDDRKEPPDGYGETPIDPMADSDTLEEAKQLEDDLRHEAPGVYALSGTRDITIEAETSTPTKPCQPIKNLRKAVEDDTLCVFACKDGTANKDRFEAWAHLIDQKFHETERDGNQHVVDYDTWTLTSSVDDDGNRTFYNTRHNYTLSATADSYPNQKNPRTGSPTAHYEEGVWALRPHPHSDVPVEWREDGDSIVVADNRAGEIARFDSLEAVVEGDKSAIPYMEYDSDDDAYYVYHNGEQKVYGSTDEVFAHYSPLKAPYLPEYDFDIPLDDVGPDDYVTIIYPDSDNDRFDQPQVYDQGELVPLEEYLDVDVTPPQVGDLTDVTDDDLTTPDTATDTDTGTASDDDLEGEREGEAEREGEREADAAGAAAAEADREAGSDTEGDQQRDGTPASASPSDAEHAGEPTEGAADTGGAETAAENEDDSGGDGDGEGPAVADAVTTAGPDDDTSREAAEDAAETDDQQAASDGAAAAADDAASPPADDDTDSPTGDTAAAQRRADDATANPDDTAADEPATDASDDDVAAAVNDTATSDTSEASSDPSQPEPEPDDDHAAADHPDGDTATDTDGDDGAADTGSTPLTRTDRFENVPPHVERKIRALPESTQLTIASRRADADTELDLSEWSIDHTVPPLKPDPHKQHDHEDFTEREDDRPTEPADDTDTGDGSSSPVVDDDPTPDQLFPDDDGQDDQEQATDTDDDDTIDPDGRLY